MIICVEDFYGDAIVYGKYFSIYELREIVKNILINIEEKDFVNIFCIRYGYELWKNESGDLRYDAIIDLDTHLVYKPIY